MSNFWQKKSDSEAFSIEKLAKSYRAKLSEVAFDSKESLQNKTLIKEKKVSKISSPHEVFDAQDNIINLHDNHWANRSFNEYKRIA